jgi:hypothetical protein
MIVSHTHKLIFLRPVKVAGTSFEIALSKYLTGKDIITPDSAERDENTRKHLGYARPCNYKYTLLEILSGMSAREILDVVKQRKRPHKYYHHMTAKECRQRLGAEVWEQYQKVSIVRNPWDQAVSQFYWDLGRSADFSLFTRYCVERRFIFKTSKGHYFIDGEMVIDHFIRYEHFQEDIERLSSAVGGLDGLWDTFKTINAKTHTRPEAARNLAEVYAAHPDVTGLVEFFCSFEIEKFGYRLDA